MKIIIIFLILILNARWENDLKNIKKNLKQILNISLVKIILKKIFDGIENKIGLQLENFFHDIYVIF